MWKTMAIKRKIIGAAISAALIATAFNQGGCTVTVDQGFINQVSDWLDSLDAPGMGLPGDDMLMGGWQGGPCDNYE